MSTIRKDEKKTRIKRSPAIVIRKNRIEDSNRDAG